MTLTLNDRKVYVELDRNNDGSKFIMYGHYEDGDLEELTVDEMDTLQDMYEDDINAMWRG